MRGRRRQKDEIQYKFCFVGLSVPKYDTFLREHGTGQRGRVGQIEICVNLAMRRRVINWRKSAGY